MQQITANVDGVNEILSTDNNAPGPGSKIWLERSTSASGSYTSVDSELLLADTTQYTFWDPTGSSVNWYRTYISDASDSVVSEFSDPFQVGAIEAYASLDDLLETMELPNRSEGKVLNTLSDYLVRASDRIDTLCGRDFYRHPQVSGTETRSYHVKRRGATTFSMAVGEGVDIVSLTSMSLAYVTGDTPVTVAQGSTGYFLDPANPKRGWPYEDIVLSNLGGSFFYYPAGYNIVSLTGVFGWSAVPPLVQQATIDLAREWFRQGPGGGGPVGVNQFGTPVFGPGTPSTVQAVYESYRRQSFVYV